MCLATEVYKQHSDTQRKYSESQNQILVSQDDGVCSQRTSGQTPCETVMQRAYIASSKVVIEQKDKVQLDPNNNVNNNKEERGKVSDKNESSLDKRAQDLQNCLRIQQVKPVDLPGASTPRSLIVNGARFDSRWTYMKNGSIILDCKQLDRKGLTVPKAVLKSDCSQDTKQIVRHSSSNLRPSNTSNITSARKVSCSIRTRTASTTDSRPQRISVCSARVVGEAVQGQRRISVLSGTDRKRSVVNFSRGGRRSSTLRLVRYLKTGETEVRYMGSFSCRFKSIFHSPEGMVRTILLLWAFWEIGRSGLFSCCRPVFVYWEGTDQ